MEPKKILIIALIVGAAILAFFLLSPTKAAAQTPAMGGGGTGGTPQPKTGNQLPHGLGWNPGDSQLPVGVTVTAPGPCLGVDPGMIVRTQIINSSDSGVGVVKVNYNCADEPVSVENKGTVYPWDSDARKKITAAVKSAKMGGTSF